MHSRLTRVEHDFGLCQVCGCALDEDVAGLQADGGVRAVDDGRQAAAAEQQQQQQQQQRQQQQQQSSRAAEQQSSRGGAAEEMRAEAHGG